MTIQTLALYAPPALIALAAIVVYVVAQWQDRKEPQTPAE
jgi:asparagine N-glycosylation enzyme membrane subunit Stt3